MKKIVRILFKLLLVSSEIILIGLVELFNILAGVLDKTVKIILRTIIVLFMVGSVLFSGWKIYQSQPHTYTVPVIGVIKDFDEFKWDIFVIDNIAKEGDTINVMINSPGGSTYPMLKLVNSLRMTPANTVAHVHELAASAGATIMLSCNEIHIDKGSRVLFHQAFESMSDGSKFIDDKASVNLMLNSLFEDKLFPLLTPEQVSTYQSGRDVWIDGKLFEGKYTMYHVIKDFVFMLKSLTPKIYTPNTVPYVPPAVPPTVVVPK